MRRVTDAAWAAPISMTGRQRVDSGTVGLSAFGFQHVPRPVLPTARSTRTCTGRGFASRSVSVMRDLPEREGRTQLERSRRRDSARSSAAGFVAAGGAGGVAAGGTGGVVAGGTVVSGAGSSTGATEPGLGCSTRTSSIARPARLVSLSESRWNRRRTVLPAYSEMSARWTPQPMPYLSVRVLRATYGLAPSQANSVRELPPPSSSTETVA